MCSIALVIQDIVFLQCCYECVSGLQAQNLSDEYKAGKVLACQLLCTCLVRRHDMDVPVDVLTRFYKLLHKGLRCEDQVCGIHLELLKWLYKSQHFVKAKDVILVLIIESYFYTTLIIVLFTYSLLN